MSKNKYPRPIQLMPLTDAVANIDRTSFLLLYVKVCYNNSGICRKMNIL